jgi:ribokinase
MNKNHPPKLLVIGSVNWDFTATAKALPRPGETVCAQGLLQGLGGKGANQAVAAARLGACVIMMARIGDDFAGREALGLLKAEGVDTRHVAMLPKTPTGTALIVVDSHGQKQITFVPGANAALVPTDVEAVAGTISDCSAVVSQLEIPVECVTAAFRIAKAAGVLTVLDPAPALSLPDELYSFTDAIKPNATEAERLTGVRVSDRSTAQKAASWLLDRGVSVVCLSLRGEGDLLATRDEMCWQPHFRVATVDATGAGDAFTAALTVALAEGRTARSATRFAGAAAALNTTSFGAQPGLPRRDAVEQLLR